MRQLDPVNYKNGPKNNWRRTAWNVIDEFTPSPRDAIVLYLPGAQNLDRPVAERHGFLPANLIAIERERDVAEHLRRQHKQTVIEGALASVMFNWPAERRIGVVVADLTTGFEIDAASVLRWWLLFEQFQYSTILINVMRGRECGEYSEHLRPFREVLTSRAFGKHRVRYVAAEIFRYLWEAFGPDEDTEPDTATCRRWHAAICGIIEKAFLTRVLPSYQSTSGIYFDSVVLRDCGVIPRIAGDNPHASVRRKISAALALRTMRLRGDLQ